MLRNIKDAPEGMNFSELLHRSNNFFSTRCNFINDELLGEVIQEFWEGGLVYKSDKYTFAYKFRDEGTKPAHFEVSTVKMDEEGPFEDN